MSSYKSLEKIKGQKFILDLAQEMKYPEDLIFILIKDEKSLETKYPITFSNLVSCNHQKDSRGYLDYGRDLITSWLLEDYFLNELKKLGLAIELSGNDKERKILKNTKTSANSDFEIEINDKKLKMELVFDFTDYCLKNNKIDLRDNKIEKLIESNSFLLGYIVNSSKFFLINLSSLDSNKITEIKFHPIYKKPATSIKLYKEDFKDFSFIEILKELSNQ